MVKMLQIYKSQFDFVFLAKIYEYLSNTLTPRESSQM